MSDENTPGGSESPSSIPQPLGYAGSFNSEGEPDRLTRGDVACLTVRIIGIYVIVQSLQFLVTLVGFFNSDARTMATKAIPFLFTIAVGASLIVWSQKLAHWLLPRTAVEVSELPGHGPAQWQAIAFSVVGVLLVGFSAPSLVYFLTKIVANDARNGIQIASQSRIDMYLPSLLHYGTECALGIGLFLGSKRLSAWWWQIRHPELRYSEEGGVAENQNATAQIPAQDDSSAVRDPIASLKNRTS